MLVARSGCGVGVGSGVEDGAEVGAGVMVAAGWADGPQAVLINTNTVNSISSQNLFVKFLFILSLSCIKFTIWQWRDQFPAPPIQLLLAMT